MKSRPVTIIDILRRRAEESPNRTAFSFLKDGEVADINLTYGELDERARKIAASIRAVNKSNSPVILLCLPGVEYVSAMFGCFYAGALAIPAYPPWFNRDLSRLVAIIEDSQASIAIASASILGRVESQFISVSAFQGLKRLCVDTVSEDGLQKMAEAEIRGDGLAYLQYTSGSISAPKGVKVHHQNILHNLAYIDREFKHMRESISVSWLPPFHDMGLIYGILQPVYSGFQCVLMSPMSFIQRPIRWLRAISRYRATHSGGPNFSYDLCARRVTEEESASLDLSSWRVAFTGAEIVRKDTLEQFTRKFESVGFHWESFSPAYGLAEATLKVSSCPSGKAPIVAAFDPAALERNIAIEVSSSQSGGRELVGCGRPGPEMKVIIVDPHERKECPPDRVGEIWVSGPSVTLGYWDRAEETAELFNNSLEGINEVSFLRTGDLGFFHQEELFVTGRLKEMIIIRGQNHYPSDIEGTAQLGHPAVKFGCGAAFSVEVSNNERLVILQEVEHLYPGLDLQQVISAIYQAVAENHELSAHAVGLVKRGTIPRTSSGKIQRHACRSKFLNNSIEMLACRVFNTLDEALAGPTPDRESLLSMNAEERLTQLNLRLQKKTAALLGNPDAAVDSETLFVHLGLDSLMAADLINWVLAEFEVSVSLSALLGDFSVSRLSVAISDQMRPASPVLNETSSEMGDSSKSALPGGDSTICSFPLSYEQERLWFLSQVYKTDSASNISGAIRITGKVNVASLEKSLNEIVMRHNILRTVFKNESGRPVQHVLPELCLKVSQVNLHGLDDGSQQAELLKVMRRSAQFSFDLTQGPLIRATCISLSDNIAFFLIVVHHIVFDARSFSIFMRELAVLYKSLIDARASPLSNLPLQFADFVLWQRRWLQEERLAPHIAYWRARLADLPQPIFSSRKRQARDVQGPSIEYIHFEVPQELLRAVMEVGRKEGCTAFMTLLAAFKVLLYLITRGEDLIVGSPISGRFRPGWNDLIGFFAYPVVFRTDMSGDPTFTCLLGKVRNVVLETYEHMQVPFARVVQAANPQRYKASAPLFQAMFSLIKNEDMVRTDIPGLSLELNKVEGGFDAFDFVLTLIDTPAGTQGEIGYRADLFDSMTDCKLGQRYCDILKRCVTNSETRLSKFELPQGAESINYAEDQVERSVVVISSTFTAGPLQETLTFWWKYLGVTSTVEFAPYNQVFQQLVDPTSRLSDRKNSANVLLIRFEDWSRVSGEGGEMARFCQIDRQGLENIASDLVSALKTAVRYSSAPYLLVICPYSPKLDRNPDWKSCLSQVESFLISEIEHLDQVHLITTEELARLYPVSNYHDPYMDKLARVPYTPVFFSALGTAIARKLYAINNSRYKVIVLDCDGTLWKGVCAEDGPQGVEIDQTSRAVQQFMVNQHNSGMLLCLCSKNSEEDVFAVFDANPEMPLRLEHIVAWRINWTPKSENLKSLADELRLGLDSFLFVDDDPVECAEVKANCPGLLALSLPKESDKVVSFLDHVWAFDHPKATKEDRRRVTFYREEQLRVEALKSSLSLQQFLETLALDVRISEMSIDQAQRVAQLTQRTNQFNISTIRYSAGEILEMWRSSDQKCLTVEVSDRFGDYGMVGVIMYAVDGDCLDIRTFLLSCRALGRGVEKIMLSHLTQEAVRSGCKEIKIHFVRTSRNLPAYTFLEEIGADYKEPSEYGWIFSLPLGRIALTEKV